MAKLEGRRSGCSGNLVGEDRSLSFSRVATGRDELEMTTSDGCDENDTPGLGFAQHFMGETIAMIADFVADASRSVNLQQDSASAARPVRTREFVDLFEPQESLKDNC